MERPPLCLGEAQRPLQLEEARALLAAAVVRPEIEHAPASPIAIIAEDEEGNRLGPKDYVARL